MYISAGDRVRPPNKGYYAPGALGALGEERVGVIDSGPSLGLIVIPGGMYGSRYLHIFRHRGKVCHHRVQVIDYLDLGSAPPTTRYGGTTHLASSTTPPSLGRQRIPPFVTVTNATISVDTLYLARSSLGAVQQQKK